MHCANSRDARHRGKRIQKTPGVNEEDETAAMTMAAAAALVSPSKRVREQKSRRSYPGPRASWN